MKMSRIICFCFGIVFLSVAVCNTALWVIVADDNKSMDVLRMEYIAHYPSFFRNLNLSILQKVNLLTGISIVLCILSIILHKYVWSIDGMDILGKISKILLLIGIVLGGWLIFSLM